MRQSVIKYILKSGRQVSYRISPKEKPRLLPKFNAYIMIEVTSKPICTITLFILPEWIKGCFSFLTLVQQHNCSQSNVHATAKSKQQQMKSSICFFPLPQCWGRSNIKQCSMLWISGHSQQLVLILSASWREQNLSTSSMLNSKSLKPYSFAHIMQWFRMNGLCKNHMAYLVQINP